jgi:hypothetical protein
MADETGLDFSDQILALENKYQQVNFAITYNHFSFCSRIKI